MIPPYPPTQIVGAGLKEGNQETFKMRRGEKGWKIVSQIKGTDSEH